MKIIEEVKFGDPYIELAYKIIERAMKDAQGKLSNIYGNSRKERQECKERVITEARQWIREQGGDFDYYCEAIGINANDQRERLGIG